MRKHRDVSDIMALFNLFGKNKNTYIFALPGNPASALTCFYLYTIPMLRSFSKHNQPHLAWIKKKLNNDYSVKGIRAQFLKAAICGNEVAVMEGQSSAMLHTYALSNALVYVPLETQSVAKGDLVECILLSN